MGMRSTRKSGRCVIGMPGEASKTGGCRGSTVAIIDAVRR